MAHNEPSDDTNESLNKQFELETDAGKVLSTISTTLVITFIVMSIFLYNCRSFSHNSERRRVMVSRLSGFSAFMFSVMLMLQELFMIYGRNMDLKLAFIEKQSILIVIAWIMCNFMCCMMLIISCVSATKYRIMIYLIYTIQMVSCSFILSERIVIHAPVWDFIIPMVMLFLSIWMVYSVPNIFQIDSDRFGYEQDRYNNNGPTGGRYVVLTTPEQNDLQVKPKRRNVNSDSEMVEDPLGENKAD